LPRFYRLAAAKEPGRAMQFINVSSKFFNTIGRNDYSFSLTSMKSSKAPAERGLSAKFLGIAGTFASRRARLQFGTQAQEVLSRSRWLWECHARAIATSRE